MVYTISDIRERVAPVAEKYGIRAVYLFGSYARNEAGDDSDIDLAVDTAGTSLKSLFALGALYNDLESALGKPVDMVTISSLEQRPSMPSDVLFRENVERERISIYAVA